MSFTKDDKNFYIRKIVDVKMKPEEDELKKELDEYCYKTARTTIALTDKELEKLPKGLLITASTFHFYVNNYNVLTHRATRDVQVAASAHIGYSDSCKIIAVGRIAQEVQAFEKRKRALEKKRSEIREAVTGIVYGCSSTKKLLETWPEVTQIITIETEVKKQASLVPLVKNVNQLLDLKPAAKAG